MTFAEPVYLICLALLVPAVALLVVRQERRRRGDLEVFGERGLLARFSAVAAARGRLVARLLAVGALALVLVALARPQFGEKPIVVTRTGRDVLFVLDLSRSMNAEDVARSRLEAAKRSVRELLAASPGDRVGLVVFGGSAFLQVPLTLDRAAFELFLDAADTDDVSDPGTDLGSALEVAAGGFGRDSEPRYRVMVLLSDGEHLEGGLEDALEGLREGGVRVFTLGLGTVEGGPIPLRAGNRLVGYHRDAAGEVVVTRLDQEVLLRVARETGGSHAAWQGGTGVRRLGADLAQIEQREISSRTFTQLAERFQWPVALALVALAAEWLVTAGAGSAVRDRRRPAERRRP